MNDIDFISDSATFLPLWERANASTKTLANIPSTDLLYFDSVDISTQKFFDLIQAMLAFKGTTDFASLVLKPDPFSYFHFHFGKYPGFVHRAEHTDDDFFESWQKDPGTAQRTVFGRTQNDMQSCRSRAIGLCTQTENGKWAYCRVLRILFRLPASSIHFFLILGKASILRVKSS